jgi:acetyl esterase/lipase
MVGSSRDPRLSEEARNFIMFVMKNFQAPSGFDLQAMRTRSENNECFIGTFKGTEEERQVKIDETTGNKFIRERMIPNSECTHLEIPITIYTPVDVQKDKIVVYFHGGGKTISILIVIF